MERDFSIDDITGELWPPPPPMAVDAAGDRKMRRSASEWAFERFLQETDSLSSADIQHHHQSNRNGNVESTASTASFLSHPASGSSTVVPIDGVEYEAFLRGRLDLSCAAVALRMEPFVVDRNSSAAAGIATQDSADSYLEPNALVKASQEDTRGPIAMPSIPAMPNNSGSGTQTKQATSGSSREQSDDDEAEGEYETTQNMNPSDEKRTRRMLSNRESARRSRRRKQAHLSELETEVSQVRTENSSLLKRLTDISEKYSEAAVDNRVLKADVETLRAKVKMAEVTVKRATGMNPLLQAMSEMTALAMPPFNGSLIDPKQPQFSQPLQNNRDLSK